jgi:predicted outer membrane repeat protein
MKKSMKFLVAALALAALSTPAFALEHEVSGRFASFFAVTNYSATGVLADSAPTANWFDQRLRLGYNAKANENVKLVTKFELDYSFWGNSSYNTARGQGGAIGADTVNLETKNIYLDWTMPSCNMNAKIGMQGYGDAFSNIIFGSDMAGILLSHSYTNANASVGFFRWEDAAGAGQGGGTLIDPSTGYAFGEIPGRNTQDLFVLDGQYNVSDTLKVGAAYYFIKDELGAAGEANVHTLGVTAATALGAVNVNAFLLGQFGDYNATDDAKGYAAKIAANAAVGTGTLRGDLLYVSGDGNQLYVTRDGVGYYDNEMMILSRDKNQTTIDNALVYDLNNGGEGVIMAAIGYDQPFSPTLSGSANIGYASVANNQGKKGIDTIGTELNVEVVKKATDNINLSARAAYVVLGDREAGNPDNPYAVMTMVDYKF